jgi:hypothetical protein
MNFAETAQAECGGVKNTTPRNMPKVMLGSLRMGIPQPPIGKSPAGVKDV